MSLTAAQPMHPLKIEETSPDHVFKAIAYNVLPTNEDEEGRVALHSAMAISAVKDKEAAVRDKIQAVRSRLTSSSRQQSMAFLISRRSSRTFSISRFRSAPLPRSSTRKGMSLAHLTPPLTTCSTEIIFCVEDERTHKKILASQVFEFLRQCHMYVRMDVAQSHCILALIPGPPSNSSHRLHTS